MTEPAEEQQDPATVARPKPVPSGGRQDDSQSLFSADFCTKTPPIDDTISHEKDR